MKMEREWSPHDAMEAYLHTLHLCKADKYMGMGSRRRTRRSEYGSTRLIKNEVEAEAEAEAEAEVEAETEGAELISALAAGSQARVLVEVVVVNSSNQQAAAGVTPLTLALAVAAKQTKGKLIICIVPTDTAHDHHHHHHHLHLTIDLIKEQLSFYGLLDDDDDDDDGVIEFRVGNPYEQMRDVENIDFAVIDCKFDDDDDDDDVDTDTDSHRGWRLFMSLQHRLHLNPKGAILIAHNILLVNSRRPSSTSDMNTNTSTTPQSKSKSSGTSSVNQLVDQVVKGNTGRRVESSVTALPLGSSGRVQVILRIKSAITSPPPTPSKRRRNRFLVTFDS